MCVCVCMCVFTFVFFQKRAAGQIGGVGSASDDNVLGLQTLHDRRHSAELHRAGD